MPESSNTGGRKPRVSDRDLLDVFRSTTDPVLSTAEVADAVPIKRRGVLNRLRDLEDAGELASKQIGGRNTVWWILDGGDADTFDTEELRGDPTTTLAGESDDTDARADAVDDATDGPADPPADAHGADADPEEDALAERVRQYLADADTPPKTEHGRAAIVDVFQYLREHGTAKTADIQDTVYPEYADKWSSARTMWNALDRYLNRVPGVEKGGYGEWTYTDDDAVRAEVNK